MKIIVTGGNGMLGRTITSKFNSCGHEVIVADMPEHDITKTEFIDWVCGIKPDAVIHCAAMTNVDGCESNYDDAFRLNEYGSEIVAKACSKAKCRLIAISTDYVFDGELPSGISYKENCVANPKTIYGKSKLAGELAIRKACKNSIILRIAWLYGNTGPSFVHTMLKLFKTNKEVKVVNDQVGNPTSTDAVANEILFLLAHPEIKGCGRNHIVHGTCYGTCSWYDFAEAIRDMSGLKVKLVPCTTEEFPRPAPRPHNSSLDNSTLESAGFHVPFWKDALKKFMESVEK